jgi:hypothetical protein
MIPGINPKQVRPMLIRRSTPHPFSASTPRGGRMTARMNLQMSVHVKAMLTTTIWCCKWLWWWLMCPVKIIIQTSFFIRTPRRLFVPSAWPRTNYAGNRQPIFIKIHKKFNTSTHTSKMCQSISSRLPKWIINCVQWKQSVDMY